ncbi:MAG: CBS domain-containing protein [Methanophagales archaeon ANME-1-THS]|nr:MAG: CBS domain-containing protein [Methanophagales archaeon ANME-1-THS]
MRWSFQIGSIRGIPIKLHVTFLIIFLFVIWLFSANAFPIFNLTIGFGNMNISSGLKYLLGSIAAVLFFATLLFHELSHSFVAQHYGAHIRGITLFIIGGVSQMDEIPKEPHKEARISAAGPGLSLSIGLISYALYYLFGPVNLAETGALVKNAALIILGILAFYNIVLGIFNLIPAFPMDGGRLLRAWFAKRMPYIDATRRAVAVGKSFAFAMGILGLFTLQFFLLLIAIFIYFGGSEEERATVVSVTLAGVKVRDLMTRVPDVIYVPPDWTIDQLIEVLFKTKHMGYPVQESLDSPVLGVVTFADVQKIPAPKRGITRVGDVMTRALIAIRPDADAYDALKLMSTRNVGRLLVMEDGQMKGLVSRTDLMRAIQFLGTYR